MSKNTRKAGLGLALVTMALFVLSLSQADLNKHKNKVGIVYWHGDHTQNKIALTFDDGPNEPYTSQILQVLKENNIKATFFMLGKNVENQPEAAKAVADAGHAIGNHTYSHPDLIWGTQKREALQLQRAEDAIFNATGCRPYLFRPPYGADDPLTFHESEKLGYVAIKWSVSARDWERPGVHKTLLNVLNGIQNGGIILMHDGNKTKGGDRSQTVEALPLLIRELKKRGYEFVTVPELLGLD